jgi:hypothetical protein
MGRNKEPSLGELDNRINGWWLATDADFHYLKEHWLEPKLAQLRIDPHNKKALASRLATIITGKADKHWEAAAGEIFCVMLRDWSADKTEKHFAEIIQLKRELTDHPPRAWKALKAYYDYVEENRKLPSKKVLKDYIVDRPGKYSGFPSGDAEAVNQWTPIWKVAGLHKLKAR